MRPVELRRQIFRGAAHWQPPCAVSYRLRSVAGGGVALFSRPAFSGWVTRDEAAFDAHSFAVDDCGRLFWMHRQDGYLYRRDPVNGLVERTIQLADPRDGPHLFGRMLSAEHRLWILDLTSGRLITIRPDTFQIIGATSLSHAIDLSYGAGRLLSLAADGLRVHDIGGAVIGGPYAERISAPVAAGAETGGRWIYVIDDAAAGFLRFAAQDGRFDGEVGRFEDASPAGDGRRGFRPTLLLVDPEGNLFASDGSAVAHEFSPDGGYVGQTGDVSPLVAIRGLAAGTDGEIYVGSPEGIARFSREAGVAGNDGEFYTQTLDNGMDHGEGWHRIDLAAELDAGGAIDVSYASASEPGLAAAVSGIFQRNESAADKVAALNAILDDRWIGPHEIRSGASSSAAASGSERGDLRASMSHSVLVRAETKRYLWIKIRLSGLAPHARALLRELRVYYPRLSYLRYLPATYQQDPVSRDFLERFLAMFETVFGGLEATIERIPEVFDPELTPPGFLDWLARWLDLVVEEDWPDRVKRRLVQRAAGLYQRKGTPGGLADFIEAVTGSRPVIRESFESERPLILSEGGQLGLDTRVFRPPLADLRRDQRTILGYASLGASEIRSTTRVRTDPFQSAAHRFTVLLDLSLQRFRRYERGLHRIIRENAPAHVGYDIRLVAGAGLGRNAMVGINFRVANPPPLHLGYSTLGRSVCSRRVRYGPELGINSTLAGSPEDSTRTSACSDGER